MTERREAQNEAERRGQRLELLAHAGKTLVQRRPVAETVREGLALLVPTLATSAMIYLREPADAPLRLVDLLHTDPAAAGGPPAGSSRRCRSVTTRQTGVGRAVASGRIQIIGDIDETRHQPGHHGS